MNDRFSTYLKNSNQRVNQALEHYSQQATSSAALLRLREAINYSLLNGGKRIRPLLVFASAQALKAGSELNPALDDAACAIEMIHAYSLVHDDLPAMDDDDLRRGQPSCHRAFDEATAILVGDALQSMAFELLSTIEPITADRKIQLINTLANASGPNGMVGGQAIDLGSVGQALDLEQIEQLHRLKTGALIRAAISMGAVIANGTDDQLNQLDDYGQAIGLAFQVKDDILDIESETGTLGKQQGADIAKNKPTYPSLIGLDSAKQKLDQLHNQALAALEPFDEQAEPLRDLATYIITRSH